MGRGANDHEIILSDAKRLELEIEVAVALALDEESAPDTQVEHIEAPTERIELTPSSLPSSLPALDAWLEAPPLLGGGPSPVPRSAVPQLETDDVIVSGKLGPISIEQVLQLAGGLDGEVCCSVKSADVEIEVYYRNRDITFARQRNQSGSYVLGRYLLEEGWISPEQLTFAALLKDSRLLGQRLLDLGYINEWELAGALRRQTEDLVCEALRARSGRFEVRELNKLPREVESTDTALPVTWILLEGLRRIDESAAHKSGESR